MREVNFPLNITVILCSYNRCQSLVSALESLAASQLPGSVEWEVLVVDNNSSDQTRQVVEEFSHRYPGRFRYLFEPAQGKSYALNAGVRESQSEVLAFADDDATVEPGWLWSLTSALYDGEWTGAGGRIVPVWPKPLPRWLSTSDPDIMGPYVAFDLGTQAGPLTRPPYGANMAFRREAFVKYGGFRTDLGPRPGSEIRREDIEFAQRLLDGGGRLRYEPDAVVHHPVTEARMTKSFVLRWWFWYGYGEVMELGDVSGARWLISGVPVFMLRRLVRWAMQWVVSTSTVSRFRCSLNVCYIAGTALACHRRSRPAALADGLGDGHPERKPPQVGTPT
jgi:glycosyltransferase involved in cell wall biosynthesis